MGSYGGPMSSSCRLHSSAIRFTNGFPQSAEMMYWVGREQAAKTAPTEIILIQFMDALSVMPHWIDKATTIQNHLNCKRWF